MLSVEEVPDPGSVDVATGSLYVPVPSTEKNAILMEPRDGANISRVQAKSILLTRGGKQVSKGRDFSIDVYITDARVALACSKFDKGSTWYGSPVGMVVGNAVSKSMAAYRRHGKMLVGQARYPWIQRVGSTSRTGSGTEERLVIDAPHRDGSMYRLTLQLPRNVEAAKVAAQIANRAAAYRLACDPTLSAEMRAELEALAVAGPLAPSPQKNIIVFHVFSSCHKITEAAAKHAPGVTAPGSGVTGPRPEPTFGAERPRLRVTPPRPPVAPPAASAPTAPVPVPAGVSAARNDDPPIARLKGKLANRPPVEPPC